MSNLPCVIVNASLECEKKVKVTGSQCVLEECAEDNCYAMFDTQSYYCCSEMHFNVNCWKINRKMNRRMC